MHMYLCKFVSNSIILCTGLCAISLVWERLLHCALWRVTYTLYCLAPHFIKWPRGKETIRVIEEFWKMKGFPGVIGAVDGSFIQIRAPKKDTASYICRKNYPAIQLQAVCDARSLFTHCFAGYAESVHDARIFRNSPLADFIQRPNEYFPLNFHLIGDAAYILHPHVIVPFRDNGHLTARQKNFDYCFIIYSYGYWKSFWTFESEI